MYRFIVETINGKGVVQLPSYYKYLNKNTQAHISPIDNYGIAYGELSQDGDTINVCSNIDGKYDVIVFGTRKDKVVEKYWRGAERLKR